MKTIIIGAGFAGLAASRRLKREFLILESESRPGGLCRTEIKDGFTFDYTGHLMHLRNKETEKFIFRNTPTGMNKIKRVSKIFSSGVYTNYPYQSNSYGLPGRIISENITGFLDAKEKGPADTANFKKWVLTALGRGIAYNFMLPYNQKLWNYPLEKLTVKWLGRFVPQPGIAEVMEGLEKKERAEGYNAYFFYPKEGGIESVIKGLAQPVKDKILLGKKVTRVSLNDKKVFCGKEEFEYEKLIVTMPLKNFLSITDDEKLRLFSKKLKATTVFCVNAGFKPQKQINTHWIYVPEKEYPFYRIGFPHTFSDKNAPKGMASVFAEVSLNEKQADLFDKEKKGLVIKNVIKGLIKMGIIPDKKSIVTVLAMMLPGAYVIYDKDRETVNEMILPYLESKGVFAAGRWGRWEYSSMEDAVIEGFEAANRVNET